MGLARLVGVVAVLLALAATATAAAAAPAQQPPKDVRGHDAWQRAMEDLKVPGRGCFHADYPTVRWGKVKCSAPPPLPYPPAHGHRPFTIGNNNDFSARTTGRISGAEGSFDSVSGVTSETGLEGRNGTTPNADTYSLQVNTNRFRTSRCSASPNRATATNAGCLGWQQFVYSSSAQRVFIQYWLIQYNTTCPSGWTQFQFPGGTDIYCYRNAATGSTVARQRITNLRNLRLTASADSAGNDVAKMFVSGTSADASDVGSLLDLASGWTDAEFIVVGDCCSHEATFNAGSTIVVRTTIHHGRKAAPSCVQEGFTGETNNLSLVGTAAVGTGPSPAVVSRQSNTETTAAGCQEADGFGDTHLTTFRGLLYDFQASGDYVFARTPGFEVQARLRSGAPAWPNASVNKAVAARLGSTQVAVCLPDRLVVDGRPATVLPGRPLLLADGSDVSRSGNAYLIRGPLGDSMIARLFPTWIDVSVGLRQSPMTVQGLLANAGGDVHQLQARTGLVLTWPFSFASLYGTYAQSWRVAAGKSILCGPKVKAGSPKKPFSSHNIKSDLTRRAREVCKERGRVTDKALLEACTIDVVVTGDPDAARTYLGRAAPEAVGVLK